MTWILVAVVAVVLSIIISTFTYVLMHLNRHVVTETLVIKVVERQLEKEVDHVPSFDKGQRRTACMQRFERLATAEEVKLPLDLSARIDAQLSIRGK